MVKIKKPYIKFSSHHDNCSEKPAYVHGENTICHIFTLHDDHILHNIW